MSAEEMIQLEKADVLRILKSCSIEIRASVVGLVHQDHLVGSGTLVRCGERHGILTAYHVLHEHKFDFRAGSEDKLGLIVEGHERPHRFEIPLGIGATRIIDIAKPTVEDLGPDLAFMEIRPSSHLNHLTATKHFFNLSFNRSKRLQVQPTENDFMIISGFYEEGYTTETNKDGFSEIKGFKGCAAFTKIENRRQHANFDLCDLGVDYSIEDELPKTFGGYSGGGLWLTAVRKNGKTGAIKHESPILAGVVFYEEQIDKTHKILRSHLTNSIYQHAIDAIARSD